MNKKELDKGLSALVLIGFAVIWIIRLCMGNDVSAGVERGMDIAVSVMLILTYLVLLYNAWGSTGNLIFKLVYLVVAAFLIFFVVAGWIPELGNVKIPAIGF